MKQYFIYNKYIFEKEVKRYINFISAVGEIVHCFQTHKKKENPTTEHRQSRFPDSLV